MRTALKNIVAGGLLSAALGAAASAAKGSRAVRHRPK
jgi:hypothetical protein